MKDLLSISNIGIIKNLNYKNRLVKNINELINQDFGQLVQILYSIDISEAKLKNSLTQNENTDSAVIIADLIIERQLQKIKTRQQFS